MSGGGSRSVNPSHDKGLAEGAGETASLNANGNFQERPHLIETTRALRRFARDKPPAVQHAAATVIYHLIAIARGRATPQLYAALGENIERLGGK